MALAAAARRSSNEARGDEGTDMIPGHCNIHSVFGYLHVPLSFHQELFLHQHHARSKRAEMISWLVVVINLSRSALYATSANPRTSINYFSLSSPKEAVPLNRDHYRHHVCSRRGCDRPSSASSAWVSCYQHRIHSHRAWDGKNRSSLQYARYARNARCGQQ